MITRAKATIDDLYHGPDGGKAELVNGELVLMSPVGAKHGRASLRISSSLTDYEETTRGGYAFGDNVGFLVNLPNRQSFSPDAAWYIGELRGMDFLEGAPAFAVEIRSKDEYGPKADRAILDKIQDYFAAGTQVVWDVDLLGPDVIRAYRASDLNNVRRFRRDEIADAEPAVPGWRIAVNDILR